MNWLSLSSEPGLSRLTSVSSQMCRISAGHSPASIILWWGFPSMCLSGTIMSAMYRSPGSVRVAKLSASAFWLSLRAKAVAHDLMSFRGT